MNEINNLIYTLEINYANNLGIKTSIKISFHDNGLEIKTVRVGDVCITKETIYGRILSGRLDNSDIYCGYRYDYENGGNLLNINPQISIESAVSMINKTEMKSDFLSTEYVLSSILRGDHRVVTLNQGSLNVIKTISATNEKSELCSLQEIVDLLKLDGDESFIEQNNKKIYKIDDKCTIEENKQLADIDIKSQFSKLFDIMNQHPQNHKELIKLRNQIQKSLVSDTTNEVKCNE